MKIDNIELTKIQGLAASLLAYDSAVKEWNRYKKLHDKLKQLQTLRKAKMANPTDLATEIWTTTRQIKQIERNFSAMPKERNL